MTAPVADPPPMPPADPSPAAVPPRAARGAVIISAIVLLLFGGALWAVLFRAIPETNREVALIILGQLSAITAAVVYYWVGSSSGSARKDEHLVELMHRPQRPSGQP